MSKNPFIRIFGAGIAGACLAYACQKRNLLFEVVDPAGIGAGGSGNPMAVVEPRIIVKGTAEADFRIASFLYALSFYEQLEQNQQTEIWRMRGVRQSPSLSYSSKRLQKIADGISKPYPGWFDVDGDFLLFPTGGAVDTQNILNACLKTSVVPEASPRQADVEIYATGPSFLPQNLSEDILPIIPNRGVVSYFDKRDLAEVRCGAGYAIEDEQFMYCGANYQRWMNLTDESWQTVQAADHDHNTAQAEELLGQKLPAAVNGRASLRSTTPDRMPLAGKCNKDFDDEVSRYMCIGFGSRGFTYAPVVAEHLLATILQEQGPLTDALWQLMSPSRFNSRIKGEY